MKRFRFWTTILCIWLIFFFNIERILIAGGLNLIQSYTYIFVALILVVTLFLPKFRPMLFAAFVGISVSVFLILWYNQPFLKKIPILAINDVSAITLLTLIQVAAIILTSLLAGQVSEAVGQFEDVIAAITFNHIGERPKPFVEAQGVMYRELKRARYYQRPLSVLALTVDKASIQANLPDIVAEIQQAMVQEFAMAKVGRIIDEKLHHFNAIGLRNNTVIVMLPELDREAASDMASRLAEILAEKVSFSVQVGIANFPDDAITFENLIETAVHDVPLATPDMPPSNAPFAPAT